MPKKSQVSISLQLNIDPLYRFKIVQEIRIAFDSVKVEVEATSSNEEEEVKMTSVIPFKYDFEVNKLKTLTTKKKNN